MNRSSYSYFENSLLERAGQRLREWDICRLSLEDVYLAGTFRILSLSLCFVTIADLSVHSA